MEIELTDPTGDDDARQEALRLGVAPIQYRYRDRSRTELRQVYMGAVLLYGEGSEVLAAVTQVDTVEYDLALAIKNLVDGRERKQIGYLTGHGEPDLLTAGGQPMAALRAELSQTKDLVAVQLGGETGVPEEVDALLVIGPRAPVSPRAQYQLDQYLMSGRPVAFFVSNYQPDMRTLRVQPLQHELDGLLGHYGVQLNRDLVLDRSSNGQLTVPVRRGQLSMRASVNHPLVPVTNNLSTESKVVKDLGIMTLPFTSSIDLAEPLPPELSAEVLARSTTHATRSKGVQRIDPATMRSPGPAEESGTFDLLVSLRGSFTSYFADREIPERFESDDVATKIRESSPTRLVVGGSTHFVANNQTLLLNLCDWLVQDTALIDIRSKQSHLAVLEEVEPKTLRMVKLANLLGPSILLILFSTLRTMRRRRA